MQPAVARLRRRRVTGLLVGNGAPEVGPPAFEAIPTSVDLLTDAFALRQIGKDLGRLAPVFLQLGTQRPLELLDGPENSVADAVAQYVPKFLHRIKFGTVGRQRDDAHMRGQRRVPNRAHENRRHRR
jgi:hypothetical protein